MGCPGSGDGTLRVDWVNLQAFRLFRLDDDADSFTYYLLNLLRLPLLPSALLTLIVLQRDQDPEQTTLNL